MVAQLPRPSAPPSTAPGRSAFCSKIAIATQRQRERAFLLSQVDKSREPSINKSHDISRVAPATPSTIKCAHCLLQRSLMKQVNVPLCAGTLSPILDLPESITKLPHTVVALPSTDKDVALPPTVEHLSRGEQHEVGGGVGLLHPHHHPQPQKPPRGRHLTTITIPFIVVHHTICVDLWATRRPNS
jgi:hypothetical protein